MIHGNRASAFVVTGDGKTVLGELRCCVHCQHMWEYRPGSGTTRGFCSSCSGLLCMRAECLAEQRQHLAWAFANGWILTRGCIPFEEWCQRMQEKVDRLNTWGHTHGKDYQLTQSGVYVPLS